MTRFFSNQTINRIFTFFVFISFFHPGFAESELIDRQINIPDFKGTAKQLLDRISKDENLVFAYSSEVSLDYEVSFRKKQMELKNFLNALFNNLIKYIFKAITTEPVYSEMTYCSIIWNFIVKIKS